MPLGEEPIPQIWGVGNERVDIAEDVVMPLPEYVPQNWGAGQRHERVDVAKTPLSSEAWCHAVPAVADLDTILLGRQIAR